MTKVMCVECREREPVSRGLCGVCYQAANRGKYLDDYPTTKFNDNPEAHIRWAFGYYPELVRDVAIEFGFTLSNESKLKDTG